MTIEFTAGDVAGLDRAVVDPAGHAAVRDEAWSESVFKTLGELIGTQKVNNIAGHFLSDLRGRFNDTANRESIGQDAHIVKSTSGLLGFSALSGAARALEAACVGHADLASSLSAVLRAKQVAMALLNRHLTQR